MMIAFTAEYPRELPRWVLSAAIALAMHGAVAAAFMQWGDWDEPDDPTAALVIDLTPMPLSPAISPAEIPPGPEQVQAEAAPERPVESVEEVPQEKVETREVAELQPELAPAITPEVTLPEATPEVQKELPTPEV